MPENRQRITIIGAGCIGASIGMALRQSKDAPHLEIVGHDRDPGRAQQGRKQGAFDSAPVNLHMALRDAQLVILAVPLASLREVMADVGRLVDADSGIVVTDTAPLKAAPIEWATATLPSGVHYVGGNPFLAPGTQGWEPLHGLSDASAELFHEAVYALTPAADAHPGAARTVANLALVLGATPLFMDPVEHDAVSAVSETVPNLVATALFRAIAETPGWEEARRATGRSFATATAAASGNVASGRMAALLGQDAVLRGLDAVLAQLGELRRLVAERDGEGLETALSASIVGRARWALESQSRSWQMGQQTPEQANLFERTLRSLLGEGVTGKKSGS